MIMGALLGLLVLLSSAALMLAVSRFPNATLAAVALLIIVLFSCVGIEKGW